MGYYYADPELKLAIDRLTEGIFSGGDTELFTPLVDRLVYDDPYFVLSDFRAYADCQQRVGDEFRDATQWTKMSILNTARMAKFSSDRSIREYCDEIWEVDPRPVELADAREGVTNLRLSF